MKTSRSLADSRKWLVLAGVGILAGCSSESGTEGSGRAGLHLKSDIVGGTDVGGVRYQITPVDCESGSPTGEPTTITDRDLEDVLIPGGIGELEDDPLDSGSEHLFADHFETLPAGCYDVTATPITATGEDSEDCAIAFKRGVEVVEGATTEIFLLNQCAGADPGALDAIATLNHEPGVEVSFPESKFGTCAEPRVICATATDPDGDPLEFEWTLGPASPPAAGPIPVSLTVDGATGAVTECVAYEPTTDGRYDVNVKVYDLLHRGSATITIEEFLDSRGYPSRSRAELDLFFYAGDCDGDGGSGGTGTGGAASGGATSTGGTGTGGEATGGATSSGGAATGGTTSTGGTGTGGTGTGGTGTGGAGSGGDGVGGTGGTSLPAERYDVEVAFLQPVTPAVADVFESARLRWEEVITGDVPDVDFAASAVGPGYCGPGADVPPLTTAVDDLVIFADIGEIDGPGGILGQAGPCLLRSASGHPVAGYMRFDSADLAEMEASGSLSATILHEMGHVIGVGSLWQTFGLLGNPSVGSAPGSVDTFFSGAHARAAFDVVGGSTYGGMKVPVENFEGFGDGTGTRDAHWRESIFDTELMTGVVDPGSPMALSLVTVQSLADMGYVVDAGAADSYGLPFGSPLRSAEGHQIHLGNDVLDIPITVVNRRGEIIGRP